MTIVEILQTSRLEQRRLQKLMDFARIATHGEAKHQVHIGRKDMLPMICSTKAASIVCSRQNVTRRSHMLQPYCVTNHCSEEIGTMRCVRAFYTV